MFGKYQAIFRSRWRALLWSAGVLLTAYCTVPAKDEEGPGTDLLQQAAGQSHETKRDHVNPWALEKFAGPPPRP